MSKLRKIFNSLPEAEQAEFRKLILTDVSADEVPGLCAMLKNETKKKEEKEIRTAVESHREYIGKCFMKKVCIPCFPRINKYYKIVSERGVNQYHMSALTFPEKPLYWFDYRASRISLAGDYYLGSFKFHGLDVEEIGFFCFDMKNPGKKMIESFTEITSEEYEQAYDRYCRQLKKTEFCADHDRGCRVFPDSPQWKTKEK